MLHSCRVFFGQPVHLNARCTLVREEGLGEDVFFGSQLRKQMLVSNNAGFLPRVCKGGGCRSTCVVVLGGDFEDVDHVAAAERFMLANMFCQKATI